MQAVSPSVLLRQGMPRGALVQGAQESLQVSVRKGDPGWSGAQVNEYMGSRGKFRK